MSKVYEVELKGVLVIAIASLIIASVLLSFAPAVLGLIRQDVPSGLEYFPVAVYVYAAPVAFALLGISLLLIREAVVYDRGSLDWYMKELRKEKKGGTDK